VVSHLGAWPPNLSTGSFFLASPEHAFKIKRDTHTLSRRVRGGPKRVIFLSGKGRGCVCFNRSGASTPAGLLLAARARLEGVLLTDKASSIFWDFIGTAARHRYRGDCARRGSHWRRTKRPIESNGVLSGGRGAQCPGSRQTGEGRLFFFEGKKRDAGAKKKENATRKRRNPPFPFACAEEL